MTSVNVTTQKNTVTVQQGDATTVTVATLGPQGPSLPDGDKGDVTVSNNGTAIQINAQAILNSDINDNAAIAGTKISPIFGSQNIFTNGNFNINSASPAINLNDTGDNPDYRLSNSNGIFKIRDTTNSVDRFKINSIGDINISNSLIVTGNAIFGGNLTVSGTTTTINTQTLDVEDINITLGKVGSPTDITANEGGISLLGDTTKTFQWLNATDSWTSSEHIALPDDKKLQLGDSQDLAIFHDGNNSRIQDSGTGFLLLDTNTLMIRKVDGSETMAKFVANGAAELYHNNVKKAETSADGFLIQGNAVVDQVQIQGSSPRLEFNQDDHNTTFRINSGGGTLQLQVSTNNGASFSNAIGIGGVGNIFIPDNDKVNFGSLNDLTIVHDGTDSKITNKTGNLLIEAKDTETGIKVIPDGSVELYHDNIKRLETASNGAACHGRLTMHGDIFAADNHQLMLGTDADLSFLHNGTDSKITNNTFVTSGNLLIEAKGGETGIKIIPDGAVELYYDNVKRFETIDGGSKITGSLGVNTDPDTPVHILANDAQLLTVQRQGNNNASIRFRNDTASMFCGLTTNATGFAIDNDDNLASGPMLFVDRSTGNVGINSSIPSEALFINGNLALAASSGDNPTLKTTGTDNGDLLIESGSDSMAIFKRNANVQLFYDGVLAAQTVSTGLNVIGTVIKLRNTENNADLIRLFHSGTGGNGIITSEIGDVKIQPNEDGGTVKLFETTNGTTTQRLATTDVGVTINGNLFSGNINSAHDGNTSISLRDTGHGFPASEVKLSNGGRDLNIVAPKDIRLFTQAGENAIVLEANAQVELYFNGLEKARTSSTGLDVTGDVKASTGILFGSDTADDNRLDDYEIGTWTPTVESEGNIDTPSYPCTYTKIGRLVTINADIAHLTDTTSSTFIKIGGLPYVPSGTGSTGKEFSAVCHGERYGGSATIVAYLLYNSGSWGISFRFGVPSGHYSNVRHSDISDDGTDNNLRFTLTYELV